MSNLGTLQYDVWTMLGIAGGILFFGRFYVQWIVSEIRKESVIPVSFWYMSIAGCLLLFPYAFNRISPGGTFGLCFNMVVYGRNLVHIWRERGQLTPARNVGIHVFMGAVSGVAAVLTAVTWHRGYGNTADFWFWSLLWAAGQGMFFLRFLIQWLWTEYQQRSTVPRAFWHVSIISTCFHLAYFTHRLDWILAVGTLADAFIYIRNLYLSKPFVAANRAR